MTTPPTDKITDEKPFVRIKPYGRWSYYLEVVDGMFCYGGTFAYSRRGAERKAERLLAAHLRRQSRQGWEFRP